MIEAGRPRPRQPLPASGRLEFRSWDESDPGLARRLWADAAVTRYIASAPYSEEEVRARLATEAANLARMGMQYWPMFLRETGEFAGVCGLKPCPYEGSPERPELELGFHLVPEMWGRGLATEAAAAAAAFAFDRPETRRLFAGHHPENRASERVLRKLGFRYARHVFYAATGLLHPLYVLERGALVVPGTAGGP